MKRNWRFYLTCLGVVLTVPLTVRAQSGSASIVMSASVSKTITLSLGPSAAPHVRAELSALENGGVLRLVVSGSGVRNLQIPILVRSNIPYNIVASVQSQTDVVTQLSVLRIEPGGRLVAGDAVSGAVIERRRSEGRFSDIDPAVPFSILSGPRVSLGGGLNSPDNALKAILSISVKPKVEKESWTIELTLQGSGTE